MACRYFIIDFVPYQLLSVSLPRNGDRGLVNGCRLASQSRVVLALPECDLVPRVCFEDMVMGLPVLLIKV